MMPKTPLLVLLVLLLRGALGARVVFFTGEASEQLPLFLGLPSSDVPRSYGDICSFGNCSFDVLPVPESAGECLRVAGDADVVIVPAHLLQVHASSRYDDSVDLSRYFPPRRASELFRPLRVAYWREGTWGPQLSEVVQRKWIDLQMGIQFSSQVINPSFFPSDEEIFHMHSKIYELAQKNLTTDFLARTLLRPFRERADRALLVTSHCNVRPRQSYVDELTKYFRVDQYGACAEKDPSYNTSENWAGPSLMAKSDHGGRWNAQIDLASKYKFYISFENSIQRGYVTEKLLTTPLLAGVVPIYLGAPDVKKLPSIDGTTAPWFVDAFDFDSPKDLANFLDRLAKDEDKWWNYLGYWDRAPRHESTGLPAFFPNAPANVAEARRSPADKAKFLRTDKHDFYFPSRTFALCQLCDLDGLDTRIRTMPLIPNLPLWHADLGLNKCLFQQDCFCKYNCVDSGPARAFD